MKIDGALQSLLQGVSQQPARDRLPGQCTEQLNMSSDPVKGLTDRPPTDLVDTISERVPSDWKDFETRDGKKWIAQVIKSTGQVRIKDRNGVPASVTMGPNTQAYLAGGDIYRYATIDERLYVVNTKKRIGMRTDVYPYWNNRPNGVKGAIISVLGGAYGKNYTINVNGQLVASYRTPDGSEESHVNFVSTTWIAAQLAAGLQQSLQEPGWGLILQGEFILIINNPGDLFSLTVTDDAGGVNMKAMVDQVKSTSELPKYGNAGYVVRIAEHADPGDDVYYKFVLENNPEANDGSGFGFNGYWKESVAPKTPLYIVDEDMPIAVDYNPSTSSFNVHTVEWPARLSGTSSSNPDPSFIGSTIADIAVFQGRLVFATGSNVVMSRTNRFTDFWIKSVGAQADTDPIDINSNTSDGSPIQSISPHNKDLVFFTKTGQLVVYGRNVLTPSNAALVLTTSFEADLLVKPVPSGRNVFFCTSYGRYTNVREFYTQGGTDINDTRPITQHVKEYIVGSPKTMAASSNYDILLISTQSDSNEVYVYQFIWSDTEKVQSSWSKWAFQYPVEYSFFDEDMAYFIMDTPTNYVLYRMPLDVMDREGTSYPVYLDSRFDVFGCYTQFSVPVADFTNKEFTVVQGHACPYPGLAAEVANVTYNGSSYVVTLKNNMNGGDLVVGHNYHRKYVPTMPMVKDSDNTVVGTGKLRVKAFLLQVENTGYLQTYLRSKYGNEEPTVFEGRIVSDFENRVGKPSLYTGTVEVPFREDTQIADFVIESKSHLPMNLLDIEYVGQYVKKGRRITKGGA